MKVLVWGSRNLTPKHFPAMRLVLHHAMLAAPLPDLRTFLDTGGMDAQELELVAPSESLVLVNGDGPPGAERGAIGADKLAVLAASEVWPDRRRMRWHAVEPESGESWGAAAQRRNVAMAMEEPYRAYCVHTDLDRSAGSVTTGKVLLRLGLGFWYVRVDPKGSVLAVERREPK